VTSFRVAPELAGRRVDHAVVAAVPGLTVNGARRLIALGRVRVDGRPARKGDPIAAGALLEIDDDAGAGGADGARVRPDPALAVTVLYADDALVAIDKPAGVPSHPLRAGELGTAANAVVARFPECARASPDPREGGLAHRLDTETSGVLLAARTPDAWHALRAALSDPACVKTYLAEVAGDPPERGASDAEIGRTGRRGARVRVGGGRRPQAAHTDWEVLERREGTALVRARLHAGRAHQVRAHLAAAGFPVLGDPTYAGDEARALAEARGARALRLHAASIAFRHPVTGALTFVEAPAPGWAMMRA
jgi:23S rRNA pseudouridine1911/1915/1917 synthase